MILFNENAFDVVNYLSLGYKCFYRRYTTLAVATERCVTVLAPFTHIKVKYKVTHIKVTHVKVTRIKVREASSLHCFFKIVQKGSIP